MRILKLGLKAAMLVLLAVSSVIFFWFLAWLFWLGSGYFSTAWGLGSVFDDASHLARDRGIHEEDFTRARIIFEARSLFAAIAGLWGWIALYTGASLMNRPLRKVPLTIKAGLVAGLPAAIVIPSTGMSLAMYPISTALLLFTIWWLNPLDTPTSRLSRDSAPVSPGDRS